MRTRGVGVMRPTAVLLALLLSASFAPAVGARGTPANVPLVRMRDGHGSDLLFRLNPRTLQQVGRPIRTFRGGSDLKIAPDGSRLAFADPWSGGRRRGAGIHFVDLTGWRSMGVARVGRHAWLTLGWVSADRVVAITGEGPGRQRFIWVDANTREVLARRAFSGWTADAIPVQGGLAVTLGPGEGTGPLRILVLDPNGGMRTIAVDGIRAGAGYAHRAGEVLTPAVTVDPDTGRLYVVAARGLLVAEVDLATGAVAYHSRGACGRADPVRCPSNRHADVDDRHARSTTGLDARGRRDGAGGGDALLRRGRALQEHGAAGLRRIRAAGVDALPGPARRAARQPRRAGLCLGPAHPDGTRDRSGRRPHAQHDPDRPRLAAPALAAIGSALCARPCSALLPRLRRWRLS